MGLEGFEEFAGGVEGFVGLFFGVVFVVDVGWERV